MTLKRTRVLQLICLALALFFIATEQCLMAAAMSLMIIAVDSTSSNPCDEQKQKRSNS